MENIIDREFLKPFLFEGEIDENNGMNILTTKYGGTTFKSNDEIDMKCHTDFFWITKKGNLCSIDKKAPKKLKRTDNECSNDFTWVEIQNVLGEKGWMYNQTEKLQEYFTDYILNPDLDFVLFESLDELICVSRLKLAELILNKTANKKVLNYKTFKPYDLYSRSNYKRANGETNKDIMTIVPYTDLKEISVFIIKK